jgi:hypothetical protein
LLLLLNVACLAEIQHIPISITISAKEMFDSSFLLVVFCWRAHISLCCLCLFAYSDVQHSVISHVFTLFVPCCDVRYDFCIKRCSYCLPLVVYRRIHVIFMSFVFILYQTMFLTRHYTNNYQIYKHVTNLGSYTMINV